MKKIYLTTAALLACSFMNAQAFWTETSYKGAFPVTDNTPATDWTSGWTNWDPENENYATPTTTLSGNITGTTNISGTVLLQGFVHVTGKIIIAPGTVIRGDKASNACLIISRGGKIDAQGTATQPIVFTSNESIANGRAAGDWGGLIILGNGIINTGGISTNPNVSKIEGFLTTDPLRYYGGSDNTDNSGILKYVRIEFAGVSLDPATPNSEINGLTLGGVGSGTQIDHIQVSFSGDDSFEWFGGAVDCKYLIANRGIDDDFDCDFGYCGRVQFGLAVRDKNLSDIALSNGASNGFEVDNSDPINLRFPITKPVFSNMTVIGPRRDGSVTTLPSNEKFECAMHIRRNSAISIFNSLFLGWEKGLRLQNNVTFDNYNAPATIADSLGIIANTIMSADIPLHAIAEGTTTSVASSSWYQSYFATNNVDTLKTATQISFVNGFPTSLATAPDFRLNAASTASTGASFTSGKFTGGFVGMKELKNVKENLFAVYPNPTSQNSNITFNLIDKNKITVTVYDVLGNLASIVANGNEFEKGPHTLEINTSNFSGGIYYISLNLNGVISTKKLIVNK